MIPNYKQKLAERVDAGKVKVAVHRVFPLEEIDKAMPSRSETVQPARWL